MPDSNEQNLATDLANYPTIRAYLETEPANLTLLRGAQYYKDVLYSLESVERIPQSFSLFELCCFYGKSSHVSALPFTQVEKEKAVKAANYNAFQLAARNGHTRTLELLETYLTEADKKAAVKAMNYWAIQLVAKSGHLETIQHLETYLTMAEKKGAVKEKDYLEIRLAAQNDHSAVVHHFLNLDVALAYAESHDWEYGAEYVYPFVTDKLASLRAAKDAFELSTPNGVFDVEIEEAKVGFYMLRNLIRRGVARGHGETNYAAAENTLDSIRFLLSIPAIRGLCHQRLNEGYENELLRLAEGMENQEAAALLRQLPEVRRLAEPVVLYRAEAADDLDLRNIARDRESSMVALSGSERETVARVTEHYQKELEQLGGVASVFERFKDDLKKRYEKNPAEIIIADKQGNPQTLALPFTWEALQALRQTSLRNAEDYQKALEAYHQHDDHSVYRYLSIPNYWMHPHAAYVYVYYDSDNQPTPYRYSTFEEYISLISLFYLAAKDEKMPAIDGYTLESRLTLFIKQLALIGRAHNWDKSREAEKAGKKIVEEYDDIKEGDRPSCYSGVNRRLFPVLGHPLFKSLTRDIIKQTLNEQLRIYFNEAISTENVDALNKAYKGLINIEGNLREHEKNLHIIDIPPEKKQAMIERVCEQLEKAYGTQFTVQKKSVLETLKSHLTSGAQGVSDFVRFHGLVDTASILNRRINEVRDCTSATELKSSGQFAPGSSSASLGSENSESPKEKSSASPKPSSDSKK